MNKLFSYPCIIPTQADGKTVFAFSATAEEILSFATIDRIARDDTGSLSGFQRPQVARHIQEIRNYLEKSEAILPNAIVVAFTGGVIVEEHKNGIGTATIHQTKEPQAFVVDGQQRLSALAGIPNKKFEVVVSGLICQDFEELRRQFILINSSKPLPKGLVYELLPGVTDGLPDRLASRSKAAELVAKLNFDSGSSLKGQIYQHTNPEGAIKDNSLQRLIMASLNDGALRQTQRDDTNLSNSFQLLSNFFEAVQYVFKEDWNGHNPRTSRLVHGAGIMSMGYVMEYLHAMDDAHSSEQFAEGLTCLKGHTAWTSGHWEFGRDNIRQWNSIQNLARDWLEVSNFLLMRLRRERQTSIVA